MSYTVLARKYRPQTFADLAGQEHVTRTLGNALASGRVAHAFLFTGVRGVGKTTTARILAKALNCEKGPTIEPCGVCSPCKEITAGVDLDVQEMDGASNNSVEDVRRLQETIPFRPARDRSKIVIVDEVHMFSVGAFNAFLKTLEEPPPHVKFIFATTEAHKVPITIRSRCQRYDFRLIPQTIVAKRVREILAAENLEADEAAISIVSREAAGSMRDALTLLDQVVAFSAGKLIGTEVAAGLGIADREVLFGAASAMLTGDGAKVFEATAQVAERGLDLLHFGRQLTELLRDLVVLRICGPETELVAMVEEERRRASALAQATEPLELQRAFHATSLLIDEIAKSQQPRIALEMGLIRVATRPPLRAITEVLGRIEGMGGKGGSGPAGGVVGGGGGPGAGGGGASRSGGGARAAEASSPSTATGPGASASASASSSGSVPSPSSAGMIEAGSFDGGFEDGSFDAPAFDALAPATPAPTARAESSSRPSAAPVFKTPDFSAPDFKAPDFKAPGLSPAPLSPSAAPETRTPAPDVRAAAAAAPRRAAPPAASAEAMARWETIVFALTETRPALGAVLQHAVPVEISAARIVIAFPRGSFYARQADSADAKSALADIAERVLSARPNIDVTMRDEVDATSSTLARIEEERLKARHEATRKKALNHPIVVEALQLFDAGLKHVEVRIEGD
jgi:DNA polymerase-3 subunit gamma/tau